MWFEKIHVKCSCSASLLSLNELVSDPGEGGFSWRLGVGCAQGSRGLSPSVGRPCQEGPARVDSTSFLQARGLELVGHVGAAPASVSLTRTVSQPINAKTRGWDVYEFDLGTRRFDSFPGLFRTASPLRLPHRPPCPSLLGFRPGLCQLCYP